MQRRTVIRLRHAHPARWRQPHIHVRYQNSEAVTSIPDGEVLEGEIPRSKMKLVLAWIEIHQEDLMADWQLAANGQTPYKIDPLR